MSEDTKKTGDDVLATAKKRFAYSVERDAINRERAKDDIKFAAASPDDPWQWKQSDLTARGNRPTLTINKLPQHINQVTNDIRQNRPSIKYRPADSKADPKAAEILMGIARHIEANSDADVAYDNAAQAEVTHGWGYARILADYISDTSFDQDIYIRPIYNTFTCHDDPDAMDPAGADRNWFFIEDNISEEEFAKQYPDAEPVDWDSTENGDWVRKGDKTIRVVEYFEVCRRDRELLLWRDGSTSFKGDPLPPGLTVVERPLKTRKVKQRYVMWRKVTAHKVLEEKEFPSQHIPVSRALGNRYIVDGKAVISGLVRNTKDSVRMYNVAQSAIVERVMQAPKAPWDAPAEAIEGYEKVWQTANTGNHSYLPWNHKDDNGDPIPRPQRTMPAPVEPGLIQIAQGAADDIKSETGQYDASLGQRSNETSGKAIMARQREGDMSTFHYGDNLGRMVRHIGRIILDMIPKIYDTKRVARILGEDGAASNVVIDPESPEPLREERTLEGEIQRIFNPNVGTYDVYTTAGPSYTTRRQEAVDAMSQMTQANPELWRVIGDQLVKNMDWPGAEDMAKRLKAVLLPEVREADEEGDEIPPEVKAQMGQMQQQMQQLMQALEEASAKVKEMEADRQSDFNDQLIKAYDAETKRLQALGQQISPEQVQALVIQTLQQVLTSPDPTPQAPPGAEVIEQEPPQGGFFMPEEPMQGDPGMVPPPEMAATGANPGLGALPPILEEGPPSA
jgi:hypothetical protein